MSPSIKNMSAAPRNTAVAAMGEIFRVGGPQPQLLGLSGDNEVNDIPLSVLFSVERDTGHTIPSISRSLNTFDLYNEREPFSPRDGRSGAGFLRHTYPEMHPQLHKSAEMF
jgi:hypothetical protein